MLEYEAVCKFTNKAYGLAKKKGIAFHGHMTTNGYLLTSEKFDRLVKMGITKFQITVDGLAKTHNSARPLVGGSGSWANIIQNLISAKNSDLKFKITIRTNFTEEIEGNIKEYLIFLSKNFKEDRRFFFHFESAKKLGGKNDNKFDVINNEASSFYNILETSKMLGLNLQDTLPLVNPFGMNCYASSNDSFVIDFDGSVMKCTVHIDAKQNKVGTVLGGSLNIKDYLMSRWTSRGLSKRCSTCRILAVCYGKKCPATGFSKEHCDKFNEMYNATLKNLYLK